jgi:uncharacterized protein YbaR (Trm112 family)
MNLDPALLEILVCPDCRAPLAVDEDNDELVCTRCGLAYPVRDDIPVLLVDEARRTREPADAGSRPSSGADAEADAAAGAGDGPDQAAGSQA